MPSRTTQVLPWMRPGARVLLTFAVQAQQPPQHGTVLSRHGHTVSILWDGWPSPVEFEATQLRRVAHKPLDPLA